MLKLINSATFKGMHNTGFFQISGRADISKLIIVDKNIFHQNNITFMQIEELPSS